MDNYLVGFIFFLWVLQIVLLFLIKNSEGLLKNVLKKYGLVDYLILFESQWFFQKRRLADRIMNNLRSGENELFLAVNSLKKKYILNDFLIFLIFFLVVVLIIISK